MMPSNHLLKTNYVFPHEWLVCTLLQLSAELLKPFKKLKVGLDINSIAPCQMEDVFCHQLCLVNRCLEKDDDSGNPLSTACLNRSYAQKVALCTCYKFLKNYRDRFQLRGKGGV